MFCAYDEKNNIIAFHDSKRVIEKYISSMRQLHGINLSFGKIKKRSEWKLKGKDDLYLVRYENSYVQAGYSICIDLFGSHIVEEEREVIDILMKILELRTELSKSQAKNIEKCIGTITELLEEDKRYVPQMSELKSMYMTYEEYLHERALL